MGSETSPLAGHPLRRVVVNCHHRSRHTHWKRGATDTGSISAHHGNHRIISIPVAIVGKMETRESCKEELRYTPLNI